MKHPLILFLILLLYTVLPKTVLADACRASFYPSNSIDTLLERVAKKEPISTTDVNNLRIERIADHYPQLSREKVFVFVKNAEQMGFSVENAISMLKNKNFMEEFLLHPSVKTQMKDLLKNSGQDLAILDQVGKLAYRLYALHSVLKLSNNQILELVSIENNNYHKLLDISKILRTQQVLESLDLSKEEIFDFIVKHIDGQRTPFQISPELLSKATTLFFEIGFSKEEIFNFIVKHIGGQRTPFQTSPRVLSKAITLFSEMGLDHLSIRQILEASVLEFWASKQLKPSESWTSNFEQYKQFTVEEKKAILREHGLSDEVINRIPQDMFKGNIARKLGELSGMSASFVLWGGFFYWLFFY